MLLFWTFSLSKNHRFLKNINDKSVYWAPNWHIRMISKGSCHIEKFSFVSQEQSTKVSLNCNKMYNIILLYFWANNATLEFKRLKNK